MSENVKTDVSPSRASSSSNWNFFGRSFPKNEIVFFCQVIILYIVIITCIVNLTIKHNDSDGKLWIALLSSSLGYLLPNPSIRRQDTQQ